MIDKDNLCHLILSLSKTVINNRNRHLAVSGLTGSQADCISYFSGHEGASIKDFSLAADVTHQTAQGIVARLVEKDYLRIERSGADKRSQCVYLQPHGRALSEITRSNRTKTADQLLKGLSDAEAEEFVRLLNLVCENAEHDWLEN